MRARGVLTALFTAGFLAANAGRAYAHTVSPTDFDASRRTLDQQILTRLYGRIWALGGSGIIAAKPKAAVFPLAFGTLTTEESWMNDSISGEDVLRGRITFAPGPACPVCRSIRIVQVARVEVKIGRDLDWSNGQENRNLLRTSRDDARGVGQGYYVDHDASKCAAGRPCSPYYRDSWPNPDESADGANPGKPASIVDYPFGWTYFERISLESCARCVETGRILGCAQWGGSWPTIGERALREASASGSPSPAFLEAMRRFDDFYPPARR